jgi:tetratricopeptide (TPR) repeat protein
VLKFPKLLLLIAVFSVFAGAQDRSAQFKQDLGYLTNRILLIHPLPDTSKEKQTFRITADALSRRLEGMNSATFAIETARLVATLGDAHSRVLLNSIQPGLSKLPIQLAYYTEGLVVTAATEEYRSYIGARVLRIGKYSAAELLNRIQPLVSAENEMWLKQAGAQRLVIPEMLKFIGAVDSIERIPFSVVRNADEETLQIRPLPPAPPPTWIEGRKTGEGSALRYRQTGSKHWFTRVPETKILYIQYNEVSDDPQRSIQQLGKDVQQEFAGNGYERMVIDLRNNGGGNNQLNLSLLNALIQIPALQETGRLVVLIGRFTFSAGTMFALDLERHFNPVFIGEPTGGSPHFFAEPTTMTLPNTKVQIFCSTAHWQYTDPRDPRRWLTPLVSVEPSWADEVSGRDRALEEAVAFKDEPGLLTLLQSSLDSSGQSGLQAALSRFKQDPRHKWFDTEGALTTLGYRLLRNNRMMDGIAVFELNVSEHPESNAGFFNLAEALRRNGNNDRAIELYQKALSLKPSDFRSLQALESLQR